jgi:magnesium transporter
MRFELTKDFLEILRLKITEQDVFWIRENILELHFADIAEILDKLSNVEAKYIYFQLEEEVQADVLMELEEEVRDRFLASLSSKEIADQLENLDSDDAADILGDLSDEQIQEVISQMEDDEAAEDIVDLLNYDEDTAGGLMQKEFIQAKLDWPVDRCLVELRRQAEDVEKVYTIYVVDDFNKLVGVLSLKRLLFASPKTKIVDLYQGKNIISVKTSDDSEAVAKVMEKYDLVSVPVVDLQNKLVGRITLDDVVDVIKEEADKDFQLASGISERIESTFSVWRITRARIPWLIIAMLGGTLGAQVIASFEGGITKVPALAFFIPLITAMGGNVGVQSSAIVVQSLAKGNDQFGSILQKLSLIHI